MTSFVPTADAAMEFQDTQTGFVSQDGSEVHFFDIPAGPDVMIELSWVDPDPPDYPFDLD
jgi:hypothetical protein